jgi:hypothetical protein
MTNVTTNTLVFSFILETKNGTNWTASRPYLGYLFTTKKNQKEGKSWIPDGRSSILNSHQAAYTTLGNREAAMPAAGETWRIRAQIGAQVTGLSEAVESLKLYPRTVQERIRTGDTNISLDPFPTNRMICLPMPEIVSEEIISK